MNSFAKYKNSIDSILENSFKDSDKFKKNLSVIMGAMKYSKVLREFFTLYNEVDLKKFKDATESENYINECISYLKNNKSKLNKVTKILDKIIIDRKGLVDDRTNKVYENIDKVVFNNNIVDLENLNSYKKYLTEHTLNEKTYTGEIKNPKILSHVLSKNYSKEYTETLTESQQNILKNTLLMSEDTLSNEFTNIKGIALNKVNELLKESEEDNLSAKLVQTKNQITALEVSKKSYIRVRELLEDLN
tara:strand:- start:1340 stop:2080 length:741 start_codon:yes stop_codon:yes gene_type:complete